ncbi:MAG: hypothetical protein WBN59_14105, partial [Flavobacteriaceae bacterium]
MNPGLTGIWILAFLLLWMVPAEAQYRNGNPYGGRPNSIIPQSNDEKPEPKALTAEEIVDGEMPKITETAQLNDFEQAVVSSILTKYVQQSIELRILDLEPQKAREKMDQIKKNQNEELKAGLPEDKYQLIIDI